jgi:hypothetical protein
MSAASRSSVLSAARRGAILGEPHPRAALLAAGALVAAAIAVALRA